MAFIGGLEIGIAADQDPYWDRLDRMYSDASDRLRGEGPYGFDTFGRFSASDFNPVWGIPSGRPIEDIATMHGYKDVHEFLGFITGKVVVDVGGGVSMLQTGAQALGADTTIINLDLPSSFRDDPWDEKTHVKEPTEIELIASGHAMPLKSESVDLILASYSLPFHAHSADHIEGFINESLRVLRPGGIASINPPLIITNPKGETRREPAQLRLWGMIRSLSLMPGITVQFGEGLEYSEDRHTKDFMQIVKNKQPS